MKLERYGETKVFKVQKNFKRTTEQILANVSLFNLSCCFLFSLKKCFCYWKKEKRREKERKCVDPSKTRSAVVLELHLRHIRFTTNTPSVMSGLFPECVNVTEISSSASTWSTWRLQDKQLFLEPCVVWFQTQNCCRYLQFSCSWNSKCDLSRKLATSMMWNVYETQ